MTVYSIGEVIAHRRLFLVDDPAREIIVTMGKPQPFPEGNGYYCPYQIVGLGEKTSYGAGVDAFQAIELSLQRIGIDLWAWQRENGGRLRWECDDKLLGFPVPELSPDENGDLPRRI